MSYCKDKVAVVTGAGGTLCSAIAIDLAKKGAKVVLVGRTREKLEKVAGEITASGGVSSPQDVRNLIALGRANLRAAIVGKALYDGRTTLKEMNDAAEGRS